MRVRLRIAGGVASLVVLGACGRVASNRLISGTLDVASGSGAAALATNGGIGSDFALRATLDDVAVTASNGQWRCFAPDPPQHPRYEIQASDGTSYLFSIVVTTSMWHAGTIAIDDSNVALQLSLVDRFGVGSGGTLTLTTSGGLCGFRVENSELHGLKEKAARN